MTETLSYAAAMFLLAPRAVTLSPRRMAMLAGCLVVAAQGVAAISTNYPLLLATRVATGIGFGSANAALNLAARRQEQPARAISLGIMVQTLLYAIVNIALPVAGARFGVAGMFVALGGLSMLLLVGSAALPDAAPAPETASSSRPRGLSPAQIRVLVAMALFTFGSLTIWPFMERAAHAIGLSAIEFGRFQSVATLASALGNLLLAVCAAQLPRVTSLASALLVCGISAVLLTTTESRTVFAAALIAYNMSWFVTYPLLLGIGYAVERTGRLTLLCSAVWLLMMSLGSLTTGIIAQSIGSYTPVGFIALLFCAGSALVVLPFTDSSLLDPSNAKR